MNTNQFMLNPTVAPYWNPITLAATIKKTPSYESLSDEDKLKSRLDRIEAAVETLGNLPVRTLVCTEQRETRLYC